MNDNRQPCNPTQAAQENLLPTPDDLQAFFRHLLRMGATDGILGPGHPSVDGFPIRYDLEIITALKKRNLETTRQMRKALYLNS